MVRIENDSVPGLNKNSRVDTLKQDDGYMSAKRAAELMHPLRNYILRNVLTLIKSERGMKWNRTYFNQSRDFCHV